MENCANKKDIMKYIKLKSFKVYKVKKNKGFTLMELLVVVAIISILSLVTLGQFQTAKKKANDVSRKGDLNSLSKALMSYFNDYGMFPASSGVNGGSIVLNGETVTWGGTFEDTSTSPSYVYMKVMPRENIRPSSYPYCYKTSADKKKFGLFAQLESPGDKECSHSYSCNGVTYCYGISSPNSSLDANGNLQ